MDQLIKFIAQQLVDQPEDVLVSKVAKTRLFRNCMSVREISGRLLENKVAPQRRCARF